MSVLTQPSDNIYDPAPSGNPSLAQNQALATRAAQGDRQAFTEIYHLHINRIYGLSLRLTADVVKAETLAQDAFVKAWSNLGSYRGQGSLAGWLSRLTVNLWRDRFRHQARQEKMLTEAALHWENNRPDRGGVVPLLTAMDLERSLQKLPDGARMVFVLHEIEGYKHHEIAGMMNTTTGTVKSQLHRARKLLRVLLGAATTDNQGV